MQDTVRQKVRLSGDSLLHKQDTVKVLLQKNDSLKVIPVARDFRAREPVITDTLTSGARQQFSEITFGDSTSFIRSTGRPEPQLFPFTFLKTTNESRGVLQGSLRDGKPVMKEPYRADWIVPLILTAAFLFAVVRINPGASFRNLIRVLLFRGVDDESLRDTGSWFQWQSTILNLASFISISLFCYLVISHSGLSETVPEGILLWGICFGAVVISLTARHFICLATGNFSGEKEVFREYLTVIYNIYRAAGIIALLLSILVLYTDFLPVNTWITSGFIAAGAFYLIRTIRLLLIFITRHVSIYYLILYLCALEILPVVIIVKYVTGLV